MIEWMESLGLPMRLTFLSVLLSGIGAWLAIEGFNFSTRKLQQRCRAAIMQRVAMQEMATNTFPRTALRYISEAQCHRGR